jgi:SAM-dependent methyltransferase
MLIGQFGKYGETFSVNGRYTVKERVDLLDILPTNNIFNSILELGTADGSNLKFFSKKLGVPLGKSLGIDICSSESSSALGLNFIHCSIEDYLLRSNEKFDLILLSDVLEHLYNPWKVLLDVKSRMSAQGKLLISVPNLQNLNYLTAVNSGNFFYQSTGLFDETHIRFFHLRH